MTKVIKPSPAETAILQVLWEHQPCSVKAIHAHLSRTKSVGYTTTLKQIQRMHDKGLVTITVLPLEKTTQNRACSTVSSQQPLKGPFRIW